MLKRGLATVYEAKYGAEFGAYEKQYRAAEEQAKKAKVGMWAGPSPLSRFFKGKNEKVETPREYKRRMAALERRQPAGRTAKKKKKNQ